MAMVRPWADRQRMPRKTKRKDLRSIIFFDWERPDRPEHRSDASHSKIACFSRLASLKKSVKLEVFCENRSL